MKYFYTKNLRATDTTIVSDLSKTKSTVPQFNSKPEYREWCAKNTTNHIFYNCVEGSTPQERVSANNPPRKVHGFAVDYDAPVDWSSIDVLLGKQAHPPTYVSETWSGYLRLIWEFDEPVPTTEDLYPPFIDALSKILNARAMHAGFDSTCLKPSQYFELGANWRKVGVELPTSVTHTAVTKAASSKPPQVADTVIPMKDVAVEVQAQFPDRWKNTFEIGQRGPLFWIADGIERDGCQLVEHGVVCYSDRAGKGFMTWREILGDKFVKAYEQQKMGGLLDTYWYDGKSYFKVLYEKATSIKESQLVMELKAAGFSHKKRKGKNTSEIEDAILTISNINRVHAVAPVIFSRDKIVHFNSNRILNTGKIDPTNPNGDGDPAKWPFIHQWLNQLFANTKGQNPTVEYFLAWMQRFYVAVRTPSLTQGQALLLVGPTNKGKSLLSNKVIAALVGGFSDASEYLSGISQFNKDLGRVAAWVVDDTTSAASFQDQLKATELIKRAVANPRLEYMAKYSDSLSIPWTGRVIMSLNEDANSLSVIPALDSSNRDKIMALRISDTATSNFPPNHILEATIEDELPHFARWLLDWVPPKEVVSGPARFGVVSYIDERIADAAYDNSSRSSVAELVDYFAKQSRLFMEAGATEWRGTLTEFLIATMSFNDGRTVGRSNNQEFVRRGMSSMEESYKTNKHVRPIRSEGAGGGKVWVIDVSECYDIDNLGKLPTSSLAP